MAVTDLPAGCILHGVPFGQLCFACTSMAVPPFWQYQAPVPSSSGWVCPQCQRSIAPSEVACPFCGPAPRVTAGMPTGPFAPVLPVPADGDPGERPEPRAWKYPVGGPGCPGCSPEEPTVLLQLPAYMATGHQMAGIKGDGKWHDVFPGQLQARYSEYNEVRDAHVLDFRLTPQGDDA